ncbi:MAG: 4-hydroxy-3-methylbut-2-enyl diphosphate reductase, partial [bacterium]|nr:4-hydroxy-3-methylbut-2-enyl diphosphate reductase [bacterium]
KKSVDIIDTTCPKVAKVQRLAKLFSEKSYKVIIIGDKKHKEVKGIYEWSGRKAKVIDTEKEAEKIKISPRDKIAIISQTTQDGDLFKEITDKIKEKTPSSIEIFDTMCLTTRNRQGEAKKIARNSDVVLVIGSSESNNSKNLWQMAKKTNSRSYFIERVEDIKKNWFENYRTVGVLAGASTPSWIIQEVCSFIENRL